MNKNLLKHKKSIENHNTRKAIGYEPTLDFNFGYISALLSNNLITRNEFNILKECYAIEEDNIHHSFINKNGDLVREKYED